MPARLCHSRLGFNDQSRPDDRSDGHLHMICSFHAKQEPGMVLKNMKSFTAIKLIDVIINNPKESRREYMLNLFKAEGKKSSSNQRFKFWSHENHSVLLNSDLLFHQKLNYFPAPQAIQAGIGMQ
jgi:hypothetical protein